MKFSPECVPYLVEHLHQLWVGGHPRRYGIAKVHQVLSIRLRRGNEEFKGGCGERKGMRKGVKEGERRGGGRKGGKEKKV